jgi:hypothetical protein
MIPGRAKTRNQLPWLPYPKQDQMYVINAHNFNTVSDPDAAAYIAAVEAADGASLEAEVRTAIDSFVIGCKSDGNWGAIKAACIMAGARTLAGALVPLVGPAPTNFNFVSGDYNRETGLKGNVSLAKQLQSNYSFTTANQNNGHISVWLTEAEGLGTEATIGNSNSGSHSQFATTSATRIYRLNNSANVVSDTSRALGFIGASRADSSFYHHRYDQTQNTPALASSAPTTNSFTVFSRNGSNFTSARMSWYSIGEALDLALLDSRLATLMTDIAAAI